ncbi:MULTISPECIES: CidA/LrgA family protein [Dickeya]|uniref:UPF0299 membrane protein DAQ1742_01766 n=1 Tax=Dickeya aquatica TaxID=1401087 RepID=A0A375A9D1_9GAMM|nr:MULTISPECIES: CidA/LrgA family protein [Dickeya]SLM62704.1 Antiholin-like protein [Dickeya aquatica]
MNTLMMHFWQQFRAFLLIYGCLSLGISLSARLPVALPGSIIGMLILFILLSVHIIPAQWVRPGCHLLMRYMALLFVPVGVGVMQYTDLLRSQFGPVVVSCVVSTVIVLITVSGCSHLLHRPKPSHQPHAPERESNHAA